MDNRITIMIAPINITSASNIGAMDINITYNATVLNATNVENGALIDALGENVSVAHNISTSGIATINVSLATYPPAINSDGVLFNMTFHAEAVGNPAFDPHVTETWTGDVAPVDGYVNVTGIVGLKGDVNGDDKVSGIDAMQIKHAIVGLISQWW